MKHFSLFSALLFFPLFVYCQDSDSLAVVLRVDSLIKVSRDLTAKREFDQALEVNAVAEKIALEHFGWESAAYGGCCFNRGRVSHLKETYSEAEKWYLESKVIREKVLGKEHPDYAACLNNLAILYRFRGAYEKAELFFIEAKTVREKALGKEHPDYAASLSNLAGLYRINGTYEKAELLYLEAITIREKVLGKEHLEYAFSLSRLANLYREMVNHEKAESLLLEAIAIEEKILGKEHPEYATTLNILAAVYQQMGAYEKAISLFNEVNAIWERVLGKENTEYATGLGNLAVVYMDIGSNHRAELLLLEANAIQEKILGKEHIEYAWSLFCLATLYRNMGNYEKAELLFLEVKAIQEKVLGKENPYYAKSLNNLATLYEITDKLAPSEFLLAEYFTSSQSRLAHSVGFLSEKQLGDFTATFNNWGCSLFSFLYYRQMRKAQQGDLPNLTCDFALFQKGFLLDAAIRLNALTHDAPEAAELNGNLKSYRRHLATQYALPIANRQGVAELEEKANAAEKELARMVTGYADVVRQVRQQEIQAVLKKQEAAIEFMHFNVSFPTLTDSTMYVALLLRPGDSQPLFIPLFEEKQLSKLLTTDKTKPRSELFAQIYSRGATPLKTTEMAGLYKLIWQPLDSLLDGIKTVYFAPSGLLHRINFDAIPAPGKRGKILSDRFLLVRLGSTRSLVVPDLTKTDVTNEAVLFGGIQYELDTTAVQQDTMRKNMPSSATGDLSFTYADRSIPLRGENWNYLPGTEKEVSAIRPLLEKSKFSAQVFSGENATEESFKSIGAAGKPSPRVLHIATHGYFFPDPETSARFQTSPTLGAAEPVFKLSDHPMIRSGLILAGGNHAWTTGKPIKPDMEDGILTAYEISQMNLSNTELVVLSACETGLGDIQGNEGVYGLQRAFKIAGAKYLIMSLWQVPDKQTSQLMTTFYKKWLEEQMEIPEAFRAAQKELREAGLDPYYWAGFVLVE